MSTNPADWAGEFTGSYGGTRATLRDDGVDERVPGDDKPRAVRIAITDTAGSTPPPLDDLSALLAWSRGDHRAFVHVSRGQAVALREALNEWFKRHDPMR